MSLYRTQSRALTEAISDEFERLIVVLDFRVETREVESIHDVVFLDLAEVLVAFGREEPGYPLRGSTRGHGDLE